MQHAKAGSITLVQPLTMIEQKFTEASLSWDLSRLYTDLAEVKQACNNPNKPVTLSEVETACLRGLLCGHSPSEIAIELNRDITGLRVDLSRGLYAYIEILTEQRPKNWRQVAFLLEKTGYRLGLANVQQNDKAVIRQDLGVVIDVLRFCGRTKELDMLKQGLLDRTCRMMTLTGMGGMGKTALAAKLIQSGMADPASFQRAGFEGVIWRSLRYAPPVAETITQLLQFVTQSSDSSTTSTIDQQISALLTHLRSHRYLIVLDDWESVLQEGEWAGYCAKEHQGYARLLQRLAVEQHQSCLLLLSREQPIEVTSFIGSEAAVRSLKLKGLPLSDARELVITRGLAADETGLPELIQIHRGNPAAILRAAITIQDLFDGSISQFLAQTSLVLGDIVLTLLEQQLGRLVEIERAIVFWLAITGQPLSIAELKTKMNAEDRSHLLTALDSLRRRSLIEKIKSGETKEALFTLEPVVMKYVVQQFIHQLSQDICTVLQSRSIAQLGLLRSHLLVDEENNDELRFYQSQRILNRLRDRLKSQLGGDIEQISVDLEDMLAWLQDRNRESIGYAELNVTKVLELMNMSLSAY